ncbi:MAG: hypothetical protein WBN08_07385 [Thiogranum sp.]
MIDTPLKFTRPDWVPLFAAAALACYSLTGHAAKLKATADIKGCTDAGISGQATLR